MGKTSFFFLAFISVFQCLMICVAITNLNISTDQAALFALKSHITFDPRNPMAKNWSSSTSVCNWIGVKCSSRHQRITALIISDLGLTGSIPPHLGNLSFLAYLDISNNSFSGILPPELSRLRYIPPEIGNLQHLKRLSLGYNRLTGSIPLSIFNISSLQSLVLTNNSLSGELPINMCSHLPQLETLAVSLNELDGQIPSVIHECSGLQILSLSYNDFTGSIPRQFVNLSMLTNLYLGNNKLEGEIIPEIGNLRRLELLSMENSGLTGTLPSSVFNITNLYWINLHGNHLHGSLTKEMCLHLPVLQFFDIGSNEFTGNIPKEIGNCTSLVNFYLGENNFTGEVPWEIGNLFNLDRLALYQNSLGGVIPPIIFNISTLRGISLLGNYFSGSLPENICLQLPNLEELYLGINNLNGFIPASISNASKLTRLGLGYNHFTGPIPNSFGSLRHLQYLNVVVNSITSESSVQELSFFNSLTNCKHLRQLWIGDNPLNGILPASIGNLSASLERIYAANSGIRGHIPNEIGNLSSLAFFFLHGNELTGSIPRTLGRLWNLQGLNLYDNKVVGPVPNDLCNLKNLGYLSLSFNNICCSLPACLGNISSLRYIYLSGNRLNSTIPVSLWSLTDLLHLDLSSNFLSGSLPLEIRNLKVATLMNISMNQISGIIPTTVEGMKGIIELSFAFNRLEGLIPESFGNMSALESLDLSHNNLSGEVPLSLEALSHLTYFNISFNKLSGEIPTGGPFSNFTYESYMSNEALCGASRLQVPACKASFPNHRRRRKQVLVIVSTSLAACIILASMTIILIRCQKRENIPIQTDSLLAASHERISYYELERATNGFSENNLLGVGSFSSVYKATMSGSSVVAVKVFDLQKEGASRSFDTECEILRSLRHRNLVKIVSSCSNLDFKALILDYMPNGSLEMWLHSNNHFLDILLRLDIMIDVASALDYLHHGYSTTVVHCDLKPSNVLLDNDMVGHVSDFGIAKLLGVEETLAQTKTLATIGYIAPEYGSEGLVSTKCDIYSYGIMLMEAFSRKKPTDAMFEGELRLKDWIKESWPNAIIQIADPGLLRPQEENLTAKLQLISSIMELAFKCCAESPEERINVKDVLSALNKIRSRFSQFIHKH
ncbi:putative LRR receptor-like serine/threonine-protein kinase [Forsythia ovata]|uniref:non-specific serine/threonine protein kinase n=1 Tax=Forsythia ovata TaxID=205694 RepID=A0ABD1S3C4_9LAMI